MNFYVYAGNDPVNWVDVDGRLAWFAVPVAVGLITGTFNAIAAHGNGGDVTAAFAVGFAVGVVSGFLSPISATQAALFGAGVAGATTVIQFSSL